MALGSAATAAAASGDGVPLAGRPEAARPGLELQLGFRKGTNALVSRRPFAAAARQAQVVHLEIAGDGQEHYSQI